jgi:hypothetical protein
VAHIVLCISIPCCPLVDLKLVFPPSPQKAHTHIIHTHICFIHLVIMASCVSVRGPRLQIGVVLYLPDVGEIKHGEAAHSPWTGADLAEDLQGMPCIYGCMFGLGPGKSLCHGQ